MPQEAPNELYVTQRGRQRNQCNLMCCFKIESVQDAIPLGG